ncbi:hypothetical protein FHG87_010341 [Trinorchestia longiramus]|nr:hypothetical protein FHG87_010341 [Trinorchestia longiramus]
MGSEQSREALQGAAGTARPPSGAPSRPGRGNTVPPLSSTPSGSSIDRSVSSSPRPSICSDADLPYISYTVNRPIGGLALVPHYTYNCHPQHLPPCHPMTAGDDITYSVPQTAGRQDGLYLVS